jgi:hypothetical protein
MTLFLHVRLNLAWCLFVFVVASVSLAEEIPLMPGTDDSLGTISIPYAFYNENFGTAVGYVHSVVGYPQKHAGLLATAMVGSNGSGMVFLYGRDIRVPGTERLLIDPIVSVGYFDDNDGYIDGNPNFPAERAGSNQSDKDNFVIGDGWDNYFRMRFKYLLPLGNGRGDLFKPVTLKDGFLASEAKSGMAWNPMTSGRTYVELTPFYRSQQIDGDNIDSVLETNGAVLALFWDNRDFYPNPSRGNAWKVNTSKDFGWFGSSNSWTAVSSEYDQYIPLDLSPKLRQSVLALDFWTSYSPSWEETSDGSIANGPPAFSGATLGGPWRMKGYPSNRFSDKTAVYYSAELRMIPDSNPFDNWPGLQKYIGVEWVQFVPFVEVGRVASSWDVSELHSDMKVDAGMGLRVWAKGIVARLDVAVSEESVGVQMMVSQPFQF